MIAALVVLFALIQQTPPRDGAATAPGTPKDAVVRGRVVNAAGLPLHRVRLTLNGDVTNPPSTVTDMRGAFELTSVPPGKYTLTAVRAGYLTLNYGQRRPRETGRTIELKAGDTLEGVDLTLQRGGVIAGRLLDEAGDPMPATRVEALELRYIRGRRVPVAARIATTNDAGEYRLSGLEPGPYQLRASTRDVWESDDGKSTFVHAVTYFPGTAAADQSQSVSVTIGQEVAGVDFRLIAGVAARITGVVEDANGEPLAGEVVNLSDIARTTGGNLLSSGRAGSTKTDARGAFEFPKLPPGEYLVLAGGQTNRTAVPVLLGDGDIRHVVVTPRKPAALNGTVVTDDGSPLPAGVQRMAVTPVEIKPAFVLPPWGAARDASPRADGTFQISGMDGEYLLRIGTPDGWMLKSVVIRGRDMTDVPLRVTPGGPDVDGVQLVLTAKTAALSGTIVDPSGTPAPDSSVLVFAESRALWGPGSRFVKVVRPDKGGAFSVNGLPAGVYRAIARDFVPNGGWEDAEYLQSLLRDAMRIELSEDAPKTVRLTVQEAR